MEKEWRPHIVAMAKIKQEMIEVAKDELWDQYLPELAATEEQLSDVEKQLGYSLDPYYRSFLKYSNGWKNFWHDADLFGTNELVGSTADYANEMLDIIITENMEKLIGFSRNELLTIAMNKYDKDMFVITNYNSHTPGIIIWLAVDEIDRYPNFEEYFLAMIEYNQYGVISFKKEHGLE